ncbi:hypothetical protein GCM10008931_43490 [Oceanobacillus oncorhynchi subsp. oncorhynchi]|uniref:hypothetical protein n=1 Tax=Oceanobacillus oncorhynchi TaxID=545501 RepID=UPI0031DB8996
MSEAKGKEKILASLKNIFTEHLRLLDFLLEDDDDVEFFETEYRYSELDTLSAIQDFRFQQRIRKSMTKTVFINWFNKNKKEALETLFQEPLSEKDIQTFTQHDKPLAEVYQLSTGNLSIRLLSLLELWDFVKNKSESDSYDDLL